MANKTKKEYFAELRTLVADNEELVNFIDREIELLNRKSSTKRKPTEKQVANEGFKGLILETLTERDTLMSIPDLQEAIPEFADFKPQKISALLIALRKVKRIHVKKVAYFTLGAEPDEEEEA